MKNDQEARDNNEYIIIPETLIKIYADHFQFSKKDTMKRIGETPLVRKDGIADFDDKIWVLKSRGLLASLYFSVRR